MSRIAFCECGFVTDGSLPSLTPPVVGWYMLETPTLNPGFAGDTGHPIGFTALDYLRLYWNIRELTFTWDLVMTPLVTLSPPVTLIGSFTIGIASGFASETNLVTNKGTFTYSGSDASGPDSGVASVIILGGDAVPSSTQFDPAGSPPIFPSAAIEIETINVGTYGDQFISANAFAGNTDAGIALSSATLPWANGLAFFQNDPDTTWTGTVSLEASLYWAYDNGAGAVFDTSTGAQLIIPAPGGL